MRGIGIFTSIAPTDPLRTDDESFAASKYARTPLGVLLLHLLEPDLLPELMVRAFFWDEHVENSQPYIEIVCPGILSSIFIYEAVSLDEVRRLVEQHLKVAEEERDNRERRRIV